MTSAGGTPGPTRGGESGSIPPADTALDRQVIVTLSLSESFVRGTNPKWAVRVLGEVALAKAEVLLAKEQK